MTFYEITDGDLSADTGMPLIPSSLLVMKLIEV